MDWVLSTDSSRSLDFKHTDRQAHANLHLGVLICKPNPMFHSARACSPRPCFSPARLTCWRWTCWSSWVILPDKGLHLHLYLRSEAVILPDLWREKHLQNTVHISGGWITLWRDVSSAVCARRRGDSCLRPLSTVPTDRNVHCRLRNTSGWSAHSRRNKSLKQVEFKGCLTDLTSIVHSAAISTPTR